MHRINWVYQPDAEIKRCDGRRYYPPRKAALVEDTEQTEAGYTWLSQPARPPIVLPGPQMIMVGHIANRRGRSCLMVQLGPETPFTDDWMKFSRANQAQWNHNFNFWQIPLRNVRVSSAIREAWAIIQDSLICCEWGYQAEFQLRWELKRREVLAFRRFIDLINNFWISGDMPHIESPKDLISPLAMEEVLSKVQAYLKEKGVRVDRPNARHCVNYLRHNCTAYEARLELTSTSDRALKMRIFAECNTAVSKAYPLLKAEADRQISERQRSQALKPASW